MSKKSKKHAAKWESERHQHRFTLTIEDMRATARERGGKCLSKHYLGSKQALTWQCAEGHVWDARPNNIRFGKWCPFCASKKRGENARKYSIADMQAAAAKRGGKCLSRSYEGYNAKLIWECASGHQWSTTPSKILHGQWCPYCSHTGSYRVTIEEMRAIAKGRGGKCLSATCDGASARLKWECKEGHEWEARATSIRAGSWCPECSKIAYGNWKLLPASVLAEVAAEHGGEYLSKEYTGSQEKYQWRCARGHTWWATHNNVMRGTWCPFCAGKRQTIADLKALAEERGGKCLSAEFEGMRRKYLWECVAGHRWRATADSVKGGTWCASCAYGSSIGERMTREYLEQMTGKPFPMLWPDWLVNREGNRLELDGYCESLKIAFEHHGKQHFGEVAHFHRRKGDLEKLLRDDRTKRRRCAQHGITLIEVPDVFGSIQPADLYDFLAKQLRRAGIRAFCKKDDIRLDLKKIYAPEFLAKFQAVVSTKKGTLVSGKTASRECAITMRCSEGHEWNTTVGYIVRGNWCPECAGNVKLTLEGLQQLAAEHGGKCLSRTYRNARTKMRWECEKGHKWETASANIRGGSWCPICAAERAIQTKRKNLNPNAKRRYCSIEDMKAHARRLGGKCLSSEYHRTHEPLSWECRKGHRWSNSWGNIQRGQWCPECSRARRQRRSPSSTRSSR